MRSLTDVASNALTTLAAFWLALFALAGAVDLVLDAGVEMAPVRTPLMAAWFVAAVLLLLTLALPGRLRAPALLLNGVVLAAGTVVYREASGLVAPWLQVTVSAGMLVTAVGFLASSRVVPWVGLLVIGLVLAPQRWDEMVRDNSPVQLGVPLMEAALVMGLGLLGALIRAVLMQASRRGDVTLQEARREHLAAVEQRSREDALAAQMTLLHDTALNTLDALALGSREPDDALRRRCLQDAQRLEAVSQQGLETTSSLTQALEGLADRAGTLGLQVTVDAVHPDQVSIPRPVVQAMLGACEEALLNVAKHAGVAAARVRVEVTPQLVLLTVSDDGTGFDPATAPRGYGLGHSIEGRLASVGGTAQIRSGRGSGTSVELAWASQPVPEDAVDEAVWSAVLRLLVAFLAATTAFTAAVVLLEWDAFERPQVALAGGLLLGGWGMLVTWMLWRRRWIPVSVGVVTVLLAATAPFWTVSADQFCSSSFGGLGWIDPRLPLVILVVLTAGRWWRAAAALPVFLVATIAAGVVWGMLSPGCQSWAITGATYAVAILGASLFAARTLNRQAAELGLAARQRDEAREASLRATVVRAEQQDWFAPAVAACAPQLRAIGEDRLDPREPAVREECQRLSGYLRSLVSVAAAPPSVRDGLRALVQRGRDAGIDVVVRGEFAALPAPPAGVEVAQALLETVPADVHEAHELAITADASELAGSLLIHLPGLPVRAHPAPVPVPTDGVDVAVEGSDGWWMELSWRAAEVPVLVGTS